VPWTESRHNPSISKHGIFTGKQSLSRLAAYITGLEVFQITLRKGYGIPDLKVDLATLYLKAGLKGIGTMFLLTDAQVGSIVLLNTTGQVLVTRTIFQYGVWERFMEHAKPSIANPLRVCLIFLLFLVITTTLPSTV